MPTLLGLVSIWKVCLMFNHILLFALWFEFTSSVSNDDKYKQENLRQ